MPFDAFVLQCIAGEIEEKLIFTRARITKIYQPGSTELLIHFRGEMKSHTLLLSAHPARARIHFTTRHFPSPPAPPPFCMLLRKHLTGASVVSLEQTPLERVLKIHLRVINAQGGEGQKTLVAEIMERRSNLILLDAPAAEKKQIILGAVKAVPPFLNRFRTILPHHAYVPPPPQDKIHPLALDYNFFVLEAEQEQGRPVTNFLLDKLRGFSPFLAREIAARAGGNVVSKEAAPLLWQKIQELLQIATDNKWEPTMLCNEEGKPHDFTSFVPRQAGSGTPRRFQSMSELVDEFYLFREKNEEKENLQQLINRQMRHYIEKARKKEKNQLLELDNAGKAEQYRLYGELLKLNLHNVPEKAVAVCLPNVYSKEGETVKISLEPYLSPSANAQRYFKKYRKAITAAKKIAARLAATRQEIAYLESVLFSAEKSDWQGLQEIRIELEEAGYLPRRLQHPEQENNSSFKPYKFITAEGEEILVGRNNRQNDLLLRQANATDLWFHAKEMPGAHVILKGAQPGKEAIEAAALLAAGHSRGAHSANVPVDYTTVKNVRRIPGARPGMVTYTGYRTIFVTPDHKKLTALLQP
ncbi:MAG: NFACT RNA binding domain-containing protein [Bacillota bacterium]